jgi:hypothetical protein
MFCFGSTRRCCCEPSCGRFFWAGETRRSALWLRRRRRPCPRRSKDKEDNGGAATISGTLYDDPRRSNKQYVQETGAAIRPFAQARYSSPTTGMAATTTTKCRSPWNRSPWNRGDLKKAKSDSLPGDTRTTFRPTPRTHPPRRTTPLPIRQNVEHYIIGKKIAARNTRSSTRSEPGMGTHASEQLLGSETCQKLGRSRTGHHGTGET